MSTAHCTADSAAANVSLPLVQGRIACAVCPLPVGLCAGRVPCVPPAWLPHFTPGGRRLRAGGGAVMLLPSHLHTAQKRYSRDHTPGGASWGLCVMPSCPGLCCMQTCLSDSCVLVAFQPWLAFPAASCVFCTPSLLHWPHYNLTPYLRPGPGPGHAGVSFFKPLAGPLGHAAAAGEAG